MSKHVVLRYESGHTQFMREWLASHPEQREEKLAGRRLWWDRGAQSLDDLRRSRESKVPQKAYVYYDWNAF